MTEQPRGNSLRTVSFLLIAFVIGAYVGYALYSYNTQPTISTLNARVGALEGQVAGLQSQLSDLQTRNATLAGASLNALYEQVKDSVVMIKGLIPSTNILGQTTYSEVLGSGFVISHNETRLVVTNFHVVDGMVNGSMAFLDGDAYPFQVLGKDMYSDLAVLLPLAPDNKLKPLTVVSSETLRVGDQVVAVGNPYGLESTLTSGIVSALGRSIQTTSGNYLISGVIQTSAPINPGNSGGPLIDIFGRVVGITSAILSGSQNLGFAIPSDTVIRALPDLISKGSYSHPYLGVTGVSVDYIIANAIGLNYTYGVLVQSVVRDGPADRAGMRAGTQLVTIVGQQIYAGGDLIVGIGSDRIKTMDDLSSYLAVHSVPGQTVIFTVVRDGSTLTLAVVIGIRP
ncbi:MAG: PDZ domain-containing protein [Candidatus Verstraetearchaeota archaeon]|nr:PDZ domain-containing protein [Candidatus Verstraetearchaeota archaeon]